MKLLNHALNVEERFILVSFGLVSVVMLCDYKARCVIFKGFGGGRDSIWSATTTPSFGLFYFIVFFSFPFKSSPCVCRLLWLLNCTKQTTLLIVNNKNAIFTMLSTWFPFSV